MIKPDRYSYIDIHTHSTGNKPGVFSIWNHVLGRDTQMPKEDTQAFSAGIHPWFLTEENAKGLVAELQILSKRTGFVAFGECGLDPLAKVSLDFQEKVFLEQAQLALAGHKPLIIHSVRSYPRFIHLMNSIKPEVPWIFHGYTQDAVTGLSLIERGGYLSVGKDIFRTNSKIRRDIHLLPADRLFFETDDWTSPVSDIYREVASLVHCSEEQLMDQVSVNFENCFLL